MKASFSFLHFHHPLKTGLEKDGLFGFGTGINCRGYGKWEWKGSLGKIMEGLELGAEEIGLEHYVSGETFEGGL